ncbi:IS1380 family transposase [Streptomyces virens]|uniref:IS1380 family transposase n=1 Tax=Streptomyces virens TaxID=285572 RepID=A0ABP6P5E0_9ACTN
MVSQAGSVLLVETVRKTGLDQAISTALAPWRTPRAVYDPGKILLDIALAVALGGDCLADIGMLRAEPAVFGPVASDPTVSRLIDTLAPSGGKALQAIRAARAEVRQCAWKLADRKAPDADGTVTVDLDGVLVIAHSDKEGAAPTWKRTYGHHPLMGFVDHGPGGTGEPMAAMLRPGNAGSNTAADHITAAQLTLAQLPKKYRRGRRTLIRTDSAGGTHDFVTWLAQRGRWLSYSVGMVTIEAIHQHVLKVPASAWTPAVEADSEIRDGAWVAELTGDVLDGWPKGMRLIVRKEPPHPGAQLRLTGADGMRLTCLATNTAGRPIGELELRHRLRARAEDRIRAAGLRNLPLHRTAQNRIWLEIVQIALDLLAWMPMLALTGKAKLWEPRRLRLRLFTAAGQLVTTGRRRILRLARHWPWTSHITAALERLTQLPNPG